MSYLRGSANYVWCTTSVLGKGATGAVYQGVNKNSGEPVAVKTFNQLSHMRPVEVQMREFEVLKKVKHENIVKLLAIEEEQNSRGKVIVMELCTGGSLFNILDDPENAYGLQEDEFLLVLEHLTAGMKHLRDNNLVHRDLKPGNIMKFLADDGAVIYKLTDFGAARELEEGQQFVSLYGTEEYLHPDMYERAVLRKPTSRPFSATVDLWSIGVTLYHVATGSLPFRPFGGRKNKETMFYITTKKASGVISGFQTSEDAPITWSRELPASCQLSHGLGALVTPLLAGLLETEPNKIWTFEQFFSSVTQVTQAKRAQIWTWHVHTCQMLRIYPSVKELNFELLSAEIEKQSAVAPAHQLLLHNQVQVKHDRWPLQTSRQKPLILFHRENNNVALLDAGEVPKFPSFQTPVQLEADATVSKSCCSVGYCAKRQTEHVSQASTLAEEATKGLSRLISRETAEVDALRAQTLHLASVLWGRAQAVIKAQEIIAKLKPTISNSLSEDLRRKQVEVSRLHVELEKLAPVLKQLSSKDLLKEWLNLSEGLSAERGACEANKVSSLVTRLKDSWQHLLRDRATREPSYNDEQFHLLERIKASETAKKIVNLLSTQVLPFAAALADSLADWYKLAQTSFLQVEILKRDMLQAQSQLERLQESYEILEEMFLSNAEVSASRPSSPVEDRKSRSPTPSPMHSLSPPVPGGKTSPCRSPADVLAVQEEINQLLKDNSHLISFFNSLSLEMPDLDD
ncbi:inhibitor of nuclear factor kappa-B kinase subunit epsilon-like [Cloeon dipterum]|uniref:inhibitor of nuclear factor kappa-B kinase subunit epsilon-like n=1 Tax=Cloeon dipterum TaxID=197152 RepID=UPI00322044B9